MNRGDIPLNQVTWCFWEGESNPLIQACVETIKKHHYPCLIADYALLDSLGAHDVLDAIMPHKMDHQSDLVRLWLLKEFGGMWLDADTICLKEVDALRVLDDPNVNAVITCHRKTKKPMLPLVMRAGSDEAEWAFAKCTTLLSSKAQGARQRNAETSVWILDKVRRKFRNVMTIPHERYQRIFSSKCSTYLRQSPDRRHKRRHPYADNACCYHLGACKRVLNLNRKELLQSNRFVSYLFRRAFEQPGTMPGRTAELLSRVPRDIPFNITEVGVLRGNNSLRLLAQRPNIHLTMVDQWSAGDSMYNDGIDPTPKNISTQAAWDNVYKKLVEQLAKKGFDRRSTVLKGSSVEQSRHVPDNSQDIVFIDANHTYEAVVDDIRCWLPKVKKDGGYICGHDHGHRFNLKENGWGVDRAVQQLSNFLGKEATLGIDMTWFIQLDSNAPALDQLDFSGQTSASG